MSFISVFDVIGPNMVGPSSSHTAGACAIARLARQMNNGILKDVTFTLYGSFAKTYRGNGTDRALLGGIMGFATDVYPNTVDIRMENTDGHVMTVRGESIGGGKVRIVRINQVQVDFTEEFNAVIIIQQDRPGVAAHITKCLSDLNVNIAFMRIFRESKGETAYTIVESGRCLYRPDQHAWPGVRPGGQAGGISLPEPKCGRGCQCSIINPVDRQRTIHNTKVYVCRSSV